MGAEQQKPLFFAKDADLPNSSKRTLERRFVKRLAIVIGLASLAIALIASNNYLTIKHNNFEREAQQVQVFYQKMSPVMQREWQKSASLEPQNVQNFAARWQTPGVQLKFVLPTDTTRPEKYLYQFSLTNPPVDVFAVTYGEGLVSPFSYIVRPFIAMLLVGILLWLVLGRLIRSNMKRLAKLQTAMQFYATTQDSESLNAVLQTQGLNHSGDEISELNRSFLQMVEQTEGAHLEQKRVSDTLALLDEVIIDMTLDGRFVRVTKAWERLTKHVKPDGDGQYLLDWIHQGDELIWLQALKNIIEGHAEALVINFRLNSPIEVWIEGKFVLTQEGDQTQLVRGVLRDITNHYLQQQQITHMALHDTLTQLPNRTLLEQSFYEALIQANAHQRYVAVLFFDMDHFKNINDSLGHKVGDSLLIAMAERFEGQPLRKQDMLSRWGGDEFVLLLPDIKSPDEVRQLGLKVRQLLLPPFQVEGHTMPITFSIGGAVYPLDAKDMEGLFACADHAMFYAKRQGRNQLCMFSDIDAELPAKQDLDIQHRLANAIRQNEIQIYFQPIVDARTEKCTMTEVLARWHDPELGWVGPDVFIPIAENIGLIGELGMQVFDQALQSFAVWHKKGLLENLSVNISKRQLFNSNFVSNMKTVLEKYQIQPQQVVLEVTESLAIRDVDFSMTRLLELRDAGFLIAIDDFGKGHSSLAQLHELQVDKLKIDMQFVQRLNDVKGQAVMQAIIQIAKALNFCTVAEGVETQQQAEFLQTHGADYLQGYRYARPMSVLEFEDWLKQRHKLFV